MAWEEDNSDTCSVLAPVDVINTPGVLVSMVSNNTPVAEDGNPSWDSGTNYPTGARVYSASTHRVYESLKDVNTGKDPTVAANRTTATGVGTYWIDVGPTNRTAAFDTLISTPTVALSPLVITLAPGAFNGFALFGIDADTLDVKAYDAPGGNLIYSYSAPLEGSMPSDYYEYFYDRFKPQTQFIASGIDPYGASQIVITLSKTSGPISLGMLAIGDLKPLGVPQRGASVEPVDYSSIVTDAYGNTTIRKRVNATGMSIQAKMDIGEANNVLNTVKTLLGQPVVVVGSTEDMYEALTVFGLLSAQLQYNDYNMPTLNCTVKGLI
jgi:hypothetical protein